MARGRSKIYCQRCMTANELGEELCLRCGTRLMLIVEPSGSRFEEGGVAGGMEEHLLERVTAIENMLTRFLEKIEQLADLFLRQSRSAQLDSALLDTLVDVLNDAGVIPRQKVENAWHERYLKESGAEAGTRTGKLCEKMLAHYTGTQRETFAPLVRKGFDLIESGKLAGGMRVLERAAALASDNAPLNAFLGAHFFRKGRTALARDYLTRAFDADPDNWRVRLLLGLVCGDEGEPERARKLLGEAVKRGGPSFAAHCALGRLAAAEDDWKTALAEFKRALAARPCPEAHYLVGLVYYQLARDRSALRHLMKAVELDATYGAALYLLGLVQLRLGERRRAAEAFDAARASDADEPRYAAARKNPARVAGAQPPSLFEGKGRGSRRVVTGGDDRLAAVLQDDALGTPTPR